MPPAVPGQEPGREVHKRRQIAPKKVYSIDTGLANTVGFSFSANAGKLLENQVLLTLRQQSREIYYYMTPGGVEVNFYLPEKGQLVQVVQHLETWLPVNGKCVP